MINDKVFKAMSDPTRRKIIELLKERPMTAGEIASHFKHAQPTVSRHLNVLKNADLVVDQREGTYVVYRLNTSVIQGWLNWLLDKFGGGSSNEQDEE
ncbi:transcriptional repressor SdpR [Alicyclobacillus sacchari]|nr:autorepressor SdpR family transcription factor [Alicyclobacillus sacchari]GMA56987.1 transcriptional repressor SdpR [Alicyclobacillus sacchari]